MVDKQAQNGYIGSEQLKYRTSNITQSGERASERASAAVQAKKRKENRVVQTSKQTS